MNHQKWGALYHCQPVSNLDHRPGGQSSSHLQPSQGFGAAIWSSRKGPSLDLLQQVSSPCFPWPWEDRGKSMGFFQGTPVFCWETPDFWPFLERWNMVISWWYLDLSGNIESDEIWWWDLVTCILPDIISFTRYSPWISVNCQVKPRKGWWRVEGATPNRFHGNGSCGGGGYESLWDLIWVHWIL